MPLAEVMIPRVEFADRFGIGCEGAALTRELPLDPRELD
jgi:hypothetical protein